VPLLADTLEALEALAAQRSLDMRACAGATSGIHKALRRRADLRSSPTPTDRRGLGTDVMVGFRRNGWS
jgi:hypothetical protein